MNEPTRKKVAVWSWALLLLPLLALLAYTYLSNSNSTSGEPGAFDPSGVAELEIKGVPADGSTSWDDIPVPASPPKDGKLLARGKDLYAKACAACHGDSGTGDGILVSRLHLNTRPANFTTPLASIKIRSTEKGTLPADEDLFRTLTRGLPGTAMLSFRNMPEADRWALVQRVKEFFAGKRKWPEPVPLAMPPMLPKDDALMDEGRREYVKWCANCHGPQGLGGTSFAFQTGGIYPAIAFARGGGKYMLRGPKPENIARMLVSGSSGVSPMMSFRAPFYGDEPNAEELKAGNRKLWGTAYYVRSLIEEQGK